ncbi:MAG: hypothetical protein R3F10_12235 [Lysobacteraceae bacterium]
MSSSFFRSFPACLLLVLLAACSGGGSRNDLRDHALYVYGGAIRWGQIDDALTLVDPAYLEKHPFTALDRARFEQVRITGYDVKGSEQFDENRIGQIVEIRLVNEHTQAERVVTDRQIWQWDEARKTWWLTTGLPDITTSR